ncbi:MAG: hypothetical protein WCA46_24105, partial [Actinocatenispora sp.]
MRTSDTDGLPVRAADARPRRPVVVRRSTRRAVAVATTLAALLLTPVAPAHAAPTGIRSTHDIAARIGTLSAQLTEADADLRAASVSTSIAIEHYERAVVEQDRAAKVLTGARVQRRAAGRRVHRQRRQVDATVRSNYELGGTVSATAAIVAGSPADALRNVAYLQYVGDQQARTLGRYRQAKGAAQLTEGGARSALRAMTQARRRAERART